MGELKLARIVPAENGSGAHKTMGTKVLMSDGSALPGVTHITLTAGVNDLWRATIKCNVQAPEIMAGSIVDVGPVLPAWRRWLIRLLGGPCVDSTDLESLEIEWASLRRQQSHS